MIDTDLDGVARSFSRSALIPHTIKTFCLFITAALASATAISAQKIDDSRELTQTDVNLYINVIHAAASRIEHPTIDDLKASERAESARERQRQAYALFARQHQGGVKPTQDEISALKDSDPKADDIAAMTLVHSLRLKPDAIIVKEKHIDPIRYQNIKLIIETLVAQSDPDESEKEKNRKSSTSITTGQPQMSLRQRSAERVEKRNRALLEPYIPAIRKTLLVINHGKKIDDD